MSDATDNPPVPLRPPSDWLTIQQAAEAVGCARLTVERRIASGVLPAKKFLGRIYIEPQHLYSVFSPKDARPSAREGKV